MSRPTKDMMHLGIASVVAARSGCHRLKVGCVLVDVRSHVLSTGYNGRAAGLPNCNEPTSTDSSGGQPLYSNHCPNSDAPSGKPNGCEAIHAEQNALLQCRDVYAIDTCYCTHSPCLVCVKLLMNTSCRRIVFVEEFPHPEAFGLWVKCEERLWERLKF